MLHPLQLSPDTPLPTRFNNPFHYTPHPLCVEAATQVQRYLASRTDWQEELQQGKMFGVLVVRTPEGEVGFLAAFSGILAGSNVHPYFVPPVYDLLQPDGFFKVEEARISQINEQIQTLEQSATYLNEKEAYQKLQQEAETAILHWKETMKTSKQQRDEKRKAGNLTAEEEASLIRESQFQKAEVKRQERAWNERLKAQQQCLLPYEQQLAAWKEERKKRSAALQTRLFEQFRMLNARGEVADLCTLFARTPRQTPPAGAGECAAPKLLQYAYQHQLQPLAMAEFWWGHSPASELRHHGHYYPSCQSKCAPILAHMLQGLEVEPNPLYQETEHALVPTLLYEDEDLLIVDKPSGLLSVPGKHDLPSVYSWAKEHYPEATGPLIVHRLDMDTSGILLLAKNKEIHAQLQAQFEGRTVKKRYQALLTGTPALPQEGIIRLPLRPDLEERPRQLVDFTYGKPAVTRYQLLGNCEHHGQPCTRVLLYPLTGRTHQLRVHAAHPQGLNAPMVGDPLYGQPADRLCLHADRLEFEHPRTHQRLRIESKVPF